MTSRDGLDLLGQIVSANVSSLAWTTEQISKHEQGETVRYAEAFAALYDAIAKTPDTILSVRLDRLLDLHGGTRQAAERLIESEPTS